jgi:sulfate permease, SulP family
MNPEDSVEKKLSTDRKSRAYLPIPEWFFHYQKSWLRPDLIAGFTSAAVVIPKAMAYATIAGLPVQVGLYTVLVPMAIYAVMGTSRPLSVSTTTTIAVLTAAELGQVAPGGSPSSLLAASAMLTLMVGVFLILASLLRLGFIADFISEPVLVGFKAGIGVVIVLDQVPKILGIHFPKGGFFHNVVAVAHGLPETSLTTLAVGLVAVALLVGFERFFPRVPAPLIAVATGILGAYILGLSAHGVELVGRIPQGLPSITRPDFSLLRELWPGALAIALMSFTETVAAGRAFANSGEPHPRGNRELLATGLANVGGAFLGAMPAGGGTSQTAVNRLAGARTQLAEMVTVVLALATLLLLAPFLSLMPLATLAAVVIVYSLGLIRPVEFREILQIRRTEFIWALTAFGGVILLGTLKGIIAAIVLSLVSLASQVAAPPVYVLGRKRESNVFRSLSEQHPDDETYPGLLLLRLEGRVFFANAEQIGQKIGQLVHEAQPKVVVLDLSPVFDLEYTALKALSEGEKRQRELGVATWLVGLNPGVLQMVRRSPLRKALGPEGLQFTLELAVTRYLQWFTSDRDGRETAKM